MAHVFFDSNHPSLLRGPGGRVLPPVLEAEVGLPLDDIIWRLNNIKRQYIIPFFGAGASLHSVTGGNEHVSQSPPIQQQVDAMCSTFRICDSQAKLFLRMAIQFAQLMDSESTRPVSQGTIDPTEAPSSWELANAFATELEIEPFERFGVQLRRLLGQNSHNDECIGVVKAVAKLMELHQSIPQLLEIASYYGLSKRRTLISILRNRMEGVTKRTAIQEEFVQKAKHFVESRNTNELQDKKDYLFITSNYDTLLEQELESTGVPTCVVNVKLDCRYVISISETTRQILGLTDRAFNTLKQKYEPSVGFLTSNFKEPKDKTHSLAMVYKIHGSPRVPSRDLDNVIIADIDYVKFIQRNGSANQLIPAWVKTRISGARLLFLGYSFSDWNVRALYEQVVENRMSPTATTEERDEARDYVVMRSFSRLDDLFFRRWNDLSVLVTDLDTFAGQIHTRIYEQSSAIGTT